MDAAYVLEKTMGDENHAYFLESRGRKIRRKRKIKLLKHIIALYSLPLAQNVLARYVRSIAFYPPIRNASMQRDFTSDGRNSKANSLRTLVIFSCIFDVIIPDS